MEKSTKDAIDQTGWTAAERDRFARQSAEKRERLERLIRAQVFDAACFKTKTIQLPELDLFG